MKDTFLKVLITIIFLLWKLMRFLIGRFFWFVIMLFFILFYLDGNIGPFHLTLTRELNR